jgi:hypothetical protein
MVEYFDGDFTARGECLLLSKMGIPFIALIHNA